MSVTSWIIRLRAAIGLAAGLSGRRAQDDELDEEIAPGSQIFHPLQQFTPGCGVEIRPVVQKRRKVVVKAAEMVIEAAPGDAEPLAQCNCRDTVASGFLQEVKTGAEEVVALQGWDGSHRFSIPHRTGPT